MKTSRYLTLLTTASLLAPLAFAQVAETVGTATQAASAAVHSNAAANAQQAAAASSRAANASATAASAAGAKVSAAHSPAVTGVTSTAAAATTSAGASIPTTKGTVNAGINNSATVPGKPVRDPVRVAVDADVKAHGTARAPGLSAEGNPGGKISASLNSQATAAQIRNATRESRDKVLAEVEAAVESTQRSLATLRKESRELRNDAREQYLAAVNQVRVSEKALRDSLKAARRATAQEAAAAQARLAADYEGYATAVAMTESAVNGSVSTTVGANK